MQPDQHRVHRHTIILSTHQWSASASTTRGPRTPRIVPRVATFSDPQTQSTAFWTLVIYPRLYLAHRARQDLIAQASRSPGITIGPLVRVRVRGQPITRFGYLRTASSPDAPTINLVAASQPTPPKIIPRIEHPEHRHEPDHEPDHEH